MGRTCAAWLLALAGCASGPAPHEVVEPASFEEHVTAVRGGQFLEGATSLEAWLAAHPHAPDSSRVEALRWAAHARTVLQEPDLALVHLDEALALDDADPWLHYGRGTAFHTMGELRAAIVSYTLALEHDPDHLRARQWRGETRRMLGDRDGARADFEATLALLDRTSPETVAAWGADWEAIRGWVVDALDELKEL